MIIVFHYKIEHN